MSKAVYLIFGDDEYVVSSKAREIVDALVPTEDRALGLETVDGQADTVDAALEALSQCLQGLQTIGFFGARKVVWLKNASFLADTGPGRSESVKGRVAQLAELVKAGLPDGLILVVSAPKADKRWAFYRACKSAGELMEFSVPDKEYQVRQHAEQTLQRLSRERKLKLSAPAATLFLERVGTDTRLMANELEKLAVYLGDRKEARPDDVAAVTCYAREAPAWDLADAFGKRDLSRCLELVRRLLFQKESPIRLVMTLEGRIRDLMLYREALENGWLAEGRRYRGGASLEWGDVPPEVDTILSEQLARDPRATHPFRVGLLAAQARNFSRRRLSQCRDEVLRAHTTLVTSSLPDALVLELVLVRMLS